MGGGQGRNAMNHHSSRKKLKKKANHERKNKLPVKQGRTDQRWKHNKRYWGKVGKQMRELKWEKKRCTERKEGKEGQRTHNWSLWGR